MLIEQILNLNWGAWGLLTVHVLLQLVIFMSKQKYGKSSSELLFTTKILIKI